MFTGSGMSFVAHIVPFAWNKATENLEYTKKMVPALELAIGLNVANQLDELYRLLGSSNKPWNTITVSEDLHKLRKHAMLGLKWQSHVEKEAGKSLITLHVHWMPRNIKMGSSRDTPYTLLEPSVITVEGVQALSSELDHTYDAGDYNCLKPECQT